MSKPERYEPPEMDTARVIQVIETTTFRRGDGRNQSYRMVTQYFSLDGQLLAEVDPLWDTRGIPPYEKGHWTQEMEPHRRPE